MPSPLEIAEHYSHWQIQTASMPKAICMLHERFLFLVSSLTEEKRLDRAIILSKAQNILSQLQAALILEDAISKGLWHLYDYCYSLLERGDPEDLASSVAVMDILRQTFHQLLRTR